MARVRSRRAKGLVGPVLAPAEELELVCGLRAGQPSVFASHAAKAAALHALAELAALRANGLAAFAARQGYAEEDAGRHDQAVGRLELAARLLAAQ